MDNVTVDLGPARASAPAPDVGVGAPAILIGRSGGQRQTVEDMANRLQTINHEVLCGISARVRRQYHRDGAPA
jgi:alanine racemase